MRHGLALAAAAALLAFSPAGAAAPERNQAIRMGKGIGRVQLGMTMPQVRRAFGGPHLVVYRSRNFGARGRYVELGWELPGRTSWEPVTWQVGFRSASRRAPLRVTRIKTNTRAERTPKRIGTGSGPQQVIRAYPGATCVTRLDSLPDPGAWIVVEERRGGMTAFRIRDSNPADPDEGVYSVQEILVQRQWFSKGRGHESMPRGRQDFWCPK